MQRAAIIMFCVVITGCATGTQITTQDGNEFDTRTAHIHREVVRLEKMLIQEISEVNSIMRTWLAERRLGSQEQLDKIKNATKRAATAADNVTLALAELKAEVAKESEGKIFEMDAVRSSFDNVDAKLNQFEEAINHLDQIIAELS